MRGEGARRCEAGGGAGRGCGAGVRGGCGLTGSHGQRTMRPCTCTSQHPRRGRASRGCHSKGTEQGLSDCREAWRLRARRGLRGACWACWACGAVRRLERVLGSSRPRKSQSATPVARRRVSSEGGMGRAWPWRWRRQRGAARVRVRAKAAPMTTGVLALKTMKVSTLQYCSVLMLANIHARKATDTQKKLWCSTRAHE